MKDRIVVALIVAGAITLAVPIAILGLIRVAWQFGLYLAKPRTPIIAEKIRHLAEAAEVRITGQTDKQEKLDKPQASLETVATPRKPKAKRSRASTIPT